MDFLYYTFLVATGRLAARVRLNQIRRQRHTYRKRRLPWAGWAVAVANVYLRLSGASLKMLSEKEWLNREVRVHQVLGRWCDLEEGELVSSNQGPTVSAILRSKLPEEQKAKVLQTTVRELWLLHQCRIDGSYLTHGDAAAHNVCFRDGRAVWLDFERDHTSNNLTESRAQDLLALAYSAAWALGGESLELVVRALDVYPDEQVKNELRNQLLGWRRRPVELQLVQAPSYQVHLWLAKRLIEKGLTQGVRNPSYSGNP